MAENTGEHEFYQLVRAFDDPAREAEAVRYHHAILEALNNTHDHGVQDALAVIEGVARILAQLTADAETHIADGMVHYVARRAVQMRQHVVATGAQSDHQVEQ